MLICRFALVLYRDSASADSAFLNLQGTTFNGKLCEIGSVRGPSLPSGPSGDAAAAAMPEGHYASRVARKTRFDVPAEACAEKCDTKPEYGPAETCDFEPEYDPEFVGVYPTADEHYGLVLGVLSSIGPKMGWATGALECLAGLTEAQVVHEVKCRLRTSLLWRR